MKTEYETRTDSQLASDFQGAWNRSDITAMSTIRDEQNRRAGRIVNGWGLTVADTTRVNSAAAMGEAAS